MLGIRNNGAGPDARPPLVRSTAPAERTCDTSIDVGAIPPRIEPQPQSFGPTLCAVTDNVRADVLAHLLLDDGQLVDVALLDGEADAATRHGDDEHPTKA